MANILFILMPQYRDEEFTAPYNMLLEAGHKIDVAGLTDENPIVGAKGHEQAPDLFFKNLSNTDYAKYDALVIPGGPGSTRYLWDNESIQDAIKLFHEEHKVIGTICYAVIAAVQAGILLNRHATVYPTDEAKAILEEYGVRFSKDGCVALSDHKIITAQGPTFAEDFGQALVTMLK